MERPGTGRRASVAAIVVHHRGRALLDPCLGSLRAALDALDTDAELIVVDNGSDDGSRELVRERHPDVRLVELGENRGFAGGVGAGLRCSSAEWVFLLNNDATVERDALVSLLDAALADPDVGSLAAQMRFTDTSVINSAGMEVDRLGVAYSRLLGAPVARGGEQPVEVFGACGGAALYRRAMLEDIGGFDESFFVYLEDVDVAWRGRMRGWRCLYVPGAVVHHQNSATSEHGSSFKHLHVGLNRVRMLAKNADGAHLRRYALPMIAYDAAYVAAALATDRTLAPLRGRAQGLREWRAYRASVPARRPVRLSPARGLRAALARQATWRSHSAR